LTRKRIIQETLKAKKKQDAPPVKAEIPIANYEFFFETLEAKKKQDAPPAKAETSVKAAIPIVNYKFVYE